MAAGKFGVNYYLNYGNSETALNAHIFSVKVSYCLGYGNSETKARCVVSML